MVTYVRSDIALSFSSAIGIRGNLVLVLFSQALIMALIGEQWTAKQFCLEFDFLG